MNYTYPQATSTKMKTGLFDAYSILETGTFKPSSVAGFKLKSVSNFMDNVRRGSKKFVSMRA